MDGQRFDHLAKALAGGVSRRGVLRGAAAGLAGAIGLRAIRAEAGQEKKPLCHYTGSASNPWEVIEVAEPAWDSHIAHGDGFFNSNDHCGACGNVCGGGDDCHTASCVSGQCMTSVNVGASCDAGAGTCDADGVCQPNVTPLICEAGAVCQSACPGSVSGDFCSCGTTFDGGDPVCYRAENGCPGPYCDTSDECGPGFACVSLLWDGSHPCGGCDNYIIEQTGRLRGVCNPICIR